MVHKKQFQAIGLACLIGVLSVSPVFDTIAAVSWTKNNGVYVGSDGSAITGVAARGIDVSHWKQNIDWNAVARDDVQFVMLGTRYDNNVDPYFTANALAAANAGLKVGAYIYSYATTPEMAVDEANFVLNLIKDYPISYPVVFDVESSIMSTLTPAQLSEIINTFCGKIKEAGYYPMLYANDYWLNNKIDMKKVPYDVWVARYETKHTYNKASMWQATNKGSVAGVNGEVDINFSYKDFSALIPAKIWRQINNKWYYYSDYALQKGWINDGNGWYYMNEDGTLYKGWIHMDNKYYYLDEGTGKMAVGWLQMPPDSKWYYFNPTGEMITGWADIEGSRYLLAQDGKMYTDWQQIDQNWYYFGSSGKMRTGWQQIADVWYYFDTDGKMLTGWQQVEGEYYYLHEGKMLTGWLSDNDGNKYYMSTSSGRMTRGWRQIENTWYYFNEAGHMAKGWIQLSGKYYYLDPQTGKMAENCALVIDNVNYTFDQNGVCLNETNQMSGVHTSAPESSTPNPGGSVTGGNNGNTGNNSSAPGTSGNNSNNSSAPGTSGNNGNNSSAPETGNPDTTPGGGSSVNRLEEGRTDGPGH